MSIYATWLEFADGAREEHAEVEKALERKIAGYVAGAPWRYEGSHVLPSVNGTRAGYFQVSAIPDHIQRRDARPPFDWLRFDVAADGSTATVVLDREQATKLRDMLTEWLTRAIED